VRHLFEEAREDRKDEAYADGVEADCGEDDGKGFVHGEIQTTKMMGRPMTRALR
jgi:hypothetical protein